MKLKHHAFVTEYLKHRDAYLAYVHVYNVQSDNYIATLSSANRLLNRTDVSAAIQAVQDAIRADVEYELKQEMKKELLTVQRKRELLAQIATGELYVMQYYKGKDCNHCSQHVAPTINQMLRAIDLDNRLAGHYPDIKHHPKQQTTTIHNKTEVDSPPESREPVPPLREVGGGSFAPEQKELPSQGGVRGGSLAPDNPLIPNPDQLSQETPIQPQQSTTKTNTDSPPIIRSSATGAVTLAQEVHQTQHTTTKINTDSPPVLRRGMLRDLPSAGSSATGEVLLATEPPKTQQSTTKTNLKTQLTP